MNGKCSLECMNGGSCVNGTCMCTSKYIGSSCQYGKTKRKRDNKHCFYV
jgi:hypothetical protein